MITARTPNTGVLEAQQNTITEEVITPVTAHFLPPPLFHHCAANKGINDAQKQPARMGCEKAPWHRSRPCRITVIAETPPKTENRLRPVLRSRRKNNATGTLIQIQPRMTWSTSSQLRTRQRNRKYMPSASKECPNLFTSASEVPILTVYRTKAIVVQNTMALSVRFHLNATVSLRNTSRAHPKRTSIRRRSKSSVAITRRCRLDTKQAMMIIGKTAYRLGNTIRAKPSKRTATIANGWSIVWLPQSKTPNLVACSWST